MSGLVEIRDLSRHFLVRRALLARAVRLQAVAGVSLDIARGETLGIVGESGCGKSTFGRLILRLIEPSAGTVHFDGVAVTGLGKAALRLLRRRMQMVFQDPYSSLDPRCTIGAALLEPFEVQAVALTQAERHSKLAELLAMVGLGRELAEAYPHQLSGGQRQRIGIARALALSPDLIVLDEPTASLDVSVQAQIVTLLEDLRARLRLTYVFISHNLSLVNYLADRIAVMYLGRIVELLRAPGVRPRHHYTCALMDSAFSTDPAQRRTVVRVFGEVPGPLDIPQGCAYAARCAGASERCQRERPDLAEIAPGHLIACHHPR